MATPEQARERTWRFRLNDATTLEVSSPRLATEKQIRRRGRWSLIVGTLIAAAAVAAVASADAVENPTASLTDQTSGSTSYTNSTAVGLTVGFFHCPPGGDEDAVAINASNTSSSGPFTSVKVGGDPWPSGSCATGNLGPATFTWNLSSGDGAKTVYVEFRHGSTATVISDSITLDTAAPVISDLGFVSGTAGSSGWYVSAVSNKFSANDPLSGLDSSCQAAFSDNGTANYGERTVSTGSDEGHAVTVDSGPCSDVAGNNSSGLNSAAYTIDLSNPTNVAVTSPSDGSSTASSTVTVTGTAEDAISGIDSVNLIVNGSALGTNAIYTSIDNTWSQSSVALQCGANTIKARATDVAGRYTDSAQISVTRNCVSYTFTGFHGGVDPENVAKAGQAISLRWNLYNGTVAPGNEVIDPMINAGHYSLSSTKISCTLVGTGDAVPTADDAGSSGLRYDYISGLTDAAGQNVFVWKTLKDWANTCRRFDVTYGGVTKSAEFRFAK